MQVQTNLRYLPKGSQTVFTASLRGRNTVSFSRLLVHLILIFCNIRHVLEVVIHVIGVVMYIKNSTLIQEREMLHVVNTFTKRKIMDGHQYGFVKKINKRNPKTD